MITFNTDGMVTQRFAFPAPIMDYFFKNLQPHHLIKLYQSCKFFYAKYRLNIIRNLVIVDDGEEEIFDTTTTILCASNPTLKKLIDFWISDSFTYNAPLNVISMPSFSHCTIKKLESCNFLTWKEFKTLTKAGTVEELKVGRIYYDDALVLVEDVISAVPNATSIEICESEISSTTFESLTALDHQVKITKFILGNMNIKRNHLDADCNVHFDFPLIREEDFNNKDFVHQCNEQLKELGKDINKAAALILRKIKEKKA